jgi:AGZA family xanthine/uracil permease-like MFS transporter
LILSGHLLVQGRATGIFSQKDEEALEDSKGFSTKMDKALFADAIATSIGAIFGTSNTTTYVESAAGIGAGGRTGLTSVVVAALFAISSFFSPLISVCSCSSNCSGTDFGRCNDVGFLCGY